MKKTKEEELFADALRKFKQGWTLNVWRSSSPHNRWLEAPKNSRAKCTELHFNGGSMYTRLRQVSKPLSSTGTVNYHGPFKLGDHGMPEWEVFV